MRKLLILAFAVVFLAVIPAVGQAPGGDAYSVVIDHVFYASREKNSTKGLFVTAQFRIQRNNPDGTKTVTTEVPREQIAVDEDGKRVVDLEINQPRAQNLSAVLALDISGSMAKDRKLEQAKEAAQLFLDKLDPKADAGLILFDHELRLREPPVRDKARFAEQRDKLRRQVRDAQPLGGTAYLDATADAVRMLKNAEGRKAVLLMTDGMDMNSTRTIDEVIAEAVTLEVPVYTIGVGEPGSRRPVTTVLVLDQSGSMRMPANDTDTASKIEALHVAAARFVDLMPKHARTTLLPFSTTISTPDRFTNDKASLKARIKTLQPDGGTLLYDATYAGIETLAAARPEGTKALVVLTDGKDEAPGSRRSHREVIRRAKEAGVKLYMLGLGRKREINEKVIRAMAEETGGQYHHAENQQKLFEIFEQLSIDLHDDGIDEASLQRLAEETGGKYFPAKDVSKLNLIYDELASELQTTYTATFASRRARHDGTARGIDVYVEREGRRVSTKGSADINVHGVVVPEMDAGVYLALLALLCGLLVVPAGMRKAYHALGGK